MLMVRALELKAGFTRCVGECFYFTVIEVTAAVEDDGADVRAFGTLCDELADLLGALDVRGAFFEGLVEGGGGREGLARRVVDDLDVDVLVRVMDGEARTLGRSGDLAADTVVDAAADAFAIDHAHVAEMI